LGIFFLDSGRLLLGTFYNTFWIKNLNKEIVVIEQNVSAMGEKPVLYYQIN
jgi:hypothetical protein